MRNGRNTVLKYIGASLALTFLAAMEFVAQTVMVHAVPSGCALPVSDGTVWTSAQWNSCFNSMAGNGINSDITSLVGLTTPLPLSEGGTNATTASAARTSLGLGAVATLGVGQSLFSSGGNLGAHGALVGFQIFSTHGSSTYTPDTGTNEVIVEGCGAGGAGGGAQASTTTTNASLGGGGQAGGYARVLLTSGFSGATVVIGQGAAGGTGAGTAGGASTFGASISFGGGAGGTAGGVVNTLGLVAGTTSGGANTISTGTTLISTSGAQANIAYYTAARGWTSGGADSVLGAGGAYQVITTASAQAAGGNASGPCSGGGGAVSANNASGSTQSGGTATDGIIIIWEFS